MDNIRLLSSGLDLQRFTFNANCEDFPVGYYESKIEVYKAYWRRKRGKEPLIANIADSAWRVQHFKSMGYYKFWNDAMSIEINPEINPSVRVQLNSVGVQEFGIEALHRMVDDFLHDLDVHDHSPIKIGRQDITFDFAVSEIDLDPRCFVTGGRDCQLHLDNEKKVNTLYVGKRGSESMYLRNYAKLLELEKKNELNEIASYKGKLRDGEKVLRVEFEAGGKYLSNHAPDELIHSVDLRGWDVFKRFWPGLLLKYCSHVRHVLPHGYGSANSYKAKNSPLWDLILADLESYKSPKVIRLKKMVSGNEQAMAAQYARQGNTRHIAVMKNYGLSDEEIDLELKKNIERSKSPKLVLAKMKQLERCGMNVVSTNGFPGYPESLTPLPSEKIE